MEGKRHQAAEGHVVRAVGLEPTLREETEFESVASTIPPRPLNVVDI